MGNRMQLDFLIPSRAVDDLESTLHITASLTHLPKGACVIVHADGVVTTWPLPRRGSLSIGRATDADIRIDHPSVSREHAAIHVGPPLSLEDLASHNGTRVRGARLEPNQRVPLTTGDIVKIGSTLLMIQPRAVSTDTTRVLSKDFLGARAQELAAKADQVDVFVVLTSGAIPFDVALATLTAAVPREHIVASPDHEQMLVVMIDAGDQVSDVRDRLSGAALGIGVRVGIGHASSAAKTKRFDRLVSTATTQATRALKEAVKTKDDRATQHHAITLMNTAIGLYAEERYEQARAMVETALESIEDGGIATMCLASVAIAAREHGDAAYGVALLERATAIARRAGHENVVSFVAEQLATARGATPEEGSRSIAMMREARAFVVGDRSVDLSRRRPLWLVLSALADARLERSGESVGRETLLEAGWQGERMHPEAALNRLYVAIATLRKLGLRDALLNRDDGYLIDPRCDLSWK
jgi:hypothetical protein